MEPLLYVNRMTSNWSLHAALELRRHLCENPNEARLFLVIAKRLKKRTWLSARLFVSPSVREAFFWQRPHRERWPPAYDTVQAKGKCATLPFFDILFPTDAKFFAPLHFSHACRMLPHSSVTTSDHRRDVINVLWQKTEKKAWKKMKKRWQNSRGSVFEPASSANVALDMPI